MANIDLGNLTRYDGKIKEYAEDKYLSKNTANWQMTEKAGAVACYPVPDTDLEPIVDFSFKEIPPASGDKSPSNPSTITGVAQVKVIKCEKNLCPPEPTILTTYRGITFEYDSSDGGIFIQGTADADKNPLIDIISANYGSNPAPFVRGKTYSFCLICSDPNVSIQLYDKTTDIVSGNPEVSGTQFIYTINNNNRSILFRLGVTKGATVNTKAYIQIEESDIATPFEPYINTDYIIDFNNTYYGGSVNLATGMMTVTWEGAIISNVVNVDTTLPLVNTLCFAVSTPFYHYGAVSNQAGFLVCNRFISAAGNDDIEHTRGTGGVSLPAQYQNIYINKSRLDFSGAVDPANPTSAEKIAAMGAWLTANPTTVCARLFTPYTIQLTPTQIRSLFALDKNTPRLNTLYTDADSIQVGYQKHPARTSYELENAILALGGGE